MTKHEVIQQVSDVSGVEQTVIRSVLDAYFQVIKHSLMEGVSINFRKFGTFYLKHRAAKTARNISLNTTIIIPAHDIAAFKPSKEFAEELMKRSK